MTDGHSHAPVNHDRAFALGIALNVIYILIEIGVGVVIDSMALLADAGHNASDVLSLLIAWGASYLARRPPSDRRTYGLRKASVLASLSNAVILLIAMGAIAWEAFQRFLSPREVPGTTIMWVAAAGVAVNTGTALLFMKGREQDINIKGAFLHMAADAGVSVGVLLAGLAINITGLPWIDPAISIIIVVVIAIGTWGLLRDSINLALDAVPEGIDPSAVREYLAEQRGVKEVHDLHIWAMSTTQTALTAHLVKPEREDEDEFLARLADELHHKFRIAHTTIQLERRSCCGHSECPTL